MYNYEDINFVERTAKIVDKDGNTIFEELVEFPDFYSETSVNIISNKYLCNSDKKKETSLKQLIDRVSNTITKWGEKQGYFETKHDRDKFCSDLKYYQVHQYFAFNSPVYFNLGLRKDPQISACFILDINDTMDSITKNIQIEGRIFKQGSGCGSNLSTLRSRFEKVSAGGHASGPVSFLKVADTSAGVIKSGGTLRRSAKMSILNIDHPDIKEFISCKHKEENKLKALQAFGINPHSGFDLSDEVYFQNTNISVRLNNEFMNAIMNDDYFTTKFIKNNQPHEKYNARELLWNIAENAWENADPGVQFDDNTNYWNTCSNDDRIVASNPCGEYVFLNNSSCNLASLNLIKFITESYSMDDFKFEEFCNVVDLIIKAQDIVINKASYPTKEIKNNSIKYRPLGLGYTNLGALLTLLQYPYDSDEGRNTAALLTALMTGVAYNQSHELAKHLGAFQGFEKNKKPFNQVLNKHYENLKQLKVPDGLKTLYKNVDKVWKNIINISDQSGEFRNAQTTLLAPTGTISFLMGASTTGIEPEFSHVKYKRLSNSDGAVIQIINPLIKQTLKNLKYSDEEITSIEKEILNNTPLNEIKSLNSDHINIFATTSSEPAISHMGHINMIAAVQPFLSGAISKTINLPSHATVKDIYDIIIDGWKKGLKGLTVYRDGSKTFQPLSTTTESENDEEENKSEKTIHDFRRKMPAERQAITHKFVINRNFKGYLTCGLYDDGSLGEIFIDVAKEGSTLSGILKSLSLITSISLQHGVPLEILVDKLSYQKFEPNGFTNNSNIKITTSIVDYVFRYLGYNFLNDKEKTDSISQEQKITQIENDNKDEINGPPCSKCGSIMTKIGTCYLCTNCGLNEGACG